MSSFKKIDPKTLQANPFSMFDNDWALATAGSKAAFNTMTISWGGLGWLWNKPVCFTFIRKSRYTYQFIEDSDCFTLSFFGGNICRDQLKLLGSKSGRDMDKMRDSGLTPLQVDGHPAFAEATCIMVCKKLYSAEIDVSKLPPRLINAMYPGQKPDTHMAYTAEITACYVKE